MRLKFCIIKVKLIAYILGLVVKSDFIVVFYEPLPHSVIGLATLFEFYSSFTLL